MRFFHMFGNVGDGQISNRLTKQPEETQTINIPQSSCNEAGKGER